MFSLQKTCKNLSYIVLNIRHKSNANWAKLRRKKTAKDTALAHFEEFYGSVFGQQWPSIKTALLRNSKYVALVNNYGDTEKTEEYLASKGAHCLKNLINIQNAFNDENDVNEPDNPSTKSNNVEDFLSKLKIDEVTNLYPNANGAPGSIETANVKLNAELGDNVDQSTNKPAELDQSRLIDPSLGLTADSLYQYVPATKLKGMDDWLPESVHYSYYSSSKDFPLQIEPEQNFVFPEHLKVYTYEMDSEWTKFPEPKRCQTGVFNYYPLDCGSVLSVLALCLTPGDRVLDLCAAPGGKSLTALQTMLPDVVICNDSSKSRCNRIERILNDYLYDYRTSDIWQNRVMISQEDGRVFTDDQGFDKVLVDVPCTTDRHSLIEEENNIFRADRLRERLRLPEMQANLLSNALQLVKVGGAVVYSTCSLSPIQNDGVVHMALKNVFENNGIVAVVKDLTKPLRGLTNVLSLASGQIAPKYGQLVIPSLGANFGPTYFSRLVRVK